MRLFVLLVATVLTATVADDVSSYTTDEYFKIMRKYIGEERFAQNKCLLTQEEKGWHSPHSGSMDVFTLGVEGAGHHITMSLLGGMPGVKGNGGQASVPFMWRVPDELHCPFPGTHQDVDGFIKRGELIVILVRYPPSTVQSTLRRFSACHLGHRGGKTWPGNKPVEQTDAENPSMTKSKGCWKEKITAISEVRVMRDSVSMVDDHMRYPFPDDCSRMIIIPFELITQKPLALMGPLIQVLKITTSSQVASLKKKLLSFAQSEAKLTGGDSKKPRHPIHEMCCHDLGVSNVTTQSQLEIADKTNPCATRAYEFAKTYFDSRSHQFPSYYPSQELIDKSEALNPGAGLLLDAVLND